MNRKNHQVGSGKKKKEKGKRGRKKTLKPTTLISHTPTKLSSISTCCGNDKKYQMATKFYCCTYMGKWDNTLCIACGETFFNEGMWNNIPGKEGTCNVFCQYMILISDWVEKKTPIEAVWRRAMAIAKIEGTLPEKIRTIKNNSPEPIELDWNAEPVINFLKPEEFHEHYQNLAPTREKQEQWLAQLNTRLCHHCLIPSDFEYCDDCDLIYNPPPCMIYTIPEEEEPISSCASELESLINHNPDSDDNDKNTSSSSVQNSNNNKNNSNSDSNSDLNYEQYIVLPNLSKE
ncbi:hypothetical protein G9A89_020439 [Geosiphon pyriformis]|nr:hypothetical protein G9A89_020439 [Geosiphon pyriformis]